MEGVAQSQTKVDRRGFVWLRCADVTAGEEGDPREAAARGCRDSAVPPCLSRCRCPSLPFDFAVRQAELTGHLFLLD